MPYARASWFAHIFPTPTLFVASVVTPVTAADSVRLSRLGLITSLADVRTDVRAGLDAFGVRGFPSRSVRNKYAHPLRTACCRSQG